MLKGKETSRNKRVPLRKNWHVNISCYHRDASSFAFLGRCQNRVLESIKKRIITGE